jgi:hypothetical protein
MKGDLPGQGLLFPDPDGADRVAAPPAAAAPALSLPRKPTCTVGEARACTGISIRQLRYYVEDGSLLAVNSARRPVGSKADAGDAPANKLDRWRIVVRRGAEFADAGAYGKFQTLEEFIRGRFNREAQ